ncbi:Ppx/GppA family phosphatase [Nocardioides sp. GY 10113]|uniref:Ppx/GppA phosphatase family protein n=1 Tax=Nocardioides sp. GY 10113 TaxID=2569761 RepID=UPI0010A8FF5E|nr:Ppx/GppA family phosphatase [Nocardioides sp. GY 10113]TIC88095.1 Ppx/GppA family phosphatase [Nocardioides sp. GY 10113]
MTDGDPQAHPTAPAVVPRWEWRTFAGPADADALRAGTLAALPATESHESDEVYLLSLVGDGSVKLRDGVVDTKVQQHLDGHGLQQWRPTMKEPFPLDADALATAFAAAGVDAPPTDRPTYSEREVADELVGPRDDLRLARVHKLRRRTTFEGCLVEVTDLTVGDGDTTASTTTVAVEATDPALVVAAVARLGLAERHNTCMARGLRSLLGWAPQRCAVIDVGTNSVKLVLAERRDGRLHTLVDRAVVARLGEGLAETGALIAPAMDRAAAAIEEMAREARAGGPVEIAAVGTAGLRMAPNRDAFVDTVFGRCGVSVEVISGQEEARLAYLAAVSTLDVDGEHLLVFDSGGGSSQFTFGSPRQPGEQFSVDVGAVRFTERYGLDGPVDDGVLDEALAGIAADLDRLAGRPRPDAVIAIGGTSTNLAAVRHGLADYDPDAVHGTRLDLAEIDRQIELYRARTADQRRELAGLQPARAEVILAGACIVRTILTLSGQDTVTVSDRGLRHGVLAERFDPVATS